MGKLDFLVLVLSLHCFIASLVGGNEINITSDKSALIAFKSLISSDPYNVLANWSVSSSPCGWIGVTCNIRHGRVYSLKLGNLDLKGIISPQLGHLSFLVELDLSNNHFHSQIPIQLVGLRRLKLVNLSYNDFDGQVPARIGGLSILKHLDLRNNSLNGSIPLTLCNLSRLEILNLNYNLIEGTIPLEIGKLERLKILRLAGNKLSGNIPQTLSNLSSLEYLSLSLNTLSGMSLMIRSIYIYNFLQAHLFLFDGKCYLNIHYGSTYSIEG